MRSEGLNVVYSIGCMLSNVVERGGFIVLKAQGFGDGMLMRS